MAFSALFLENLTELKTRRGNSTDTTIATLLGLYYPPDEGLVFYRWFNTATDTPDDNEIVQPTVAGITTGRWFKIDYALTKAIIETALGYTPYDNTNPDGFISSFTESDPTVPTYAKSLTSSSIIKALTDIYYEPVFSKNTAFNKNFGSTSGTIAEGNDSRIVNAVPNTRTINGQALSSNITFTIPPNQVNTDWNSISGVSQLLNKPVLFSGAYTDLSGKPTTINGYGITDFNSLGDARWSLLTHTHTFASLTSKPTTLAGYGITDTIPTIAVPNLITRALNTNFTVSTTKQAFVTYSVTCSVTNPLLVGSSTASAFLEYSTNGGSTWITISQNGNVSSVGVAVAIAITNTQTLNISGYIPANTLVRIRTAVTGSGTVTYVMGQETY